MTKKTKLYLFSTCPTYGDRGFEGCPGSWAQANIDWGSIYIYIYYRQLATDILYALDAVGVLVSEVYKLEASIGLIGPL